MKLKKLSEKEKTDDVYEFNEVDENDPKTKPKKKRKILKIKKLRARKGNTEANLIHKAEKKVLINAHIKHKKTLTDSEKMEINEFNQITQPKKVVKHVIPEKKVLRSALKEKDKNIINEPTKIVEDKERKRVLKEKDKNINEPTKIIEDTEKKNKSIQIEETNVVEGIFKSPAHNENDGTLFPNHCSTPNKTPRYESLANFNYCSPIPITFGNRSMKAPINSTPLHSTEYNSIHGDLNNSMRVVNSTPLHSTQYNHPSPIQSDLNDTSIKNASCYTPIKYHNESYSIIDPKGFDLSNCFGFDAAETTMPQLTPAVKQLPVIKLIEKPKLNMPSTQEVIQQLRNELQEDTSNTDDISDTDVSRLPVNKSTFDSEDSEMPTSVFEPATIADFETSVKPPRRSYERQIRPKKKVLICDTLEDDYAESSEDEVFIKPKIVMKKGKKKYRGAAKEKPNPAMDKWVKEFNKHCEEVEQFGLCVE